jgi:hypothetical protein
VEDAPAHESRWLALVQQPSDDLLLGAGQAEMARLAVTAGQAGPNSDVSVVGTVNPLKEVRIAPLSARRHPPEEVSRTDLALADPPLTKPSFADSPFDDRSLGDVC